MRRHKWYEEIIAFAEGEVIQSKLMWEEEDRWFDEDDPDFCDKDVVFRIKPKESEWWENIPEHGVLCWVSDLYDYPKMYISLVLEYRKDEMKKFWLGERGAFRYATPLTNEEIERFKR